MVDLLQVNDTVSARGQPGKSPSLRKVSVSSDTYFRIHETIQRMLTRFIDCIRMNQWFPDRSSQQSITEMSKNYTMAPFGVGEGVPAP